MSHMQLEQVEREAGIRRDASQLPETHNNAPHHPSSTRPTSVTLGARSKNPIINWFLKLASGIILDIRARSPYYVSDWVDAWNYRVVPATALIFFAKSVLFRFPFFALTLGNLVFSPESHSLWIS